MALRDWRWPQWTLLIGGIIFILLLAIVGYVFLRPDTFTPTGPTVTPPVTGVLPTPIEGTPTFPASEVESVPLGQIQTQPGTGPDLVARGGLTNITTVTQIPVDHVSLGPNGSDINYYDPETNRFYRVDNTGVLTKVGDQVFADAQSVAWAPNLEDVIIEFPDGSNVRYNFETGDQITYPSHWTEFDFSPASSNIAFKSLGIDEDERWLAVADANGSSTRLIEHLGANERFVNIDWAPNNQVVGTFDVPSGLNESELFFLGFNGENFPLSKLHGLQFEGSWTPEGKKLVYSVMHPDTNFLPSLWIIDGVGQNMGGNRQPINLNTWTHKCTFSNETTMYCGVPQSLPRGAGLIPSVADNIPDDVYQIDLTTGNVERLAIPNTLLHVNQLIVNEEENSIYIHDDFSQTIKRIDL